MSDHPWDQQLADRADAIDVARRAGGIDLDRPCKPLGFSPTRAPADGKKPSSTTSKDAD